MLDPYIPAPRPMRPCVNPSAGTLARAFRLPMHIVEEFLADTFCTYAREVKGLLVEFDSSTRTLTRTPVKGA